MSSTELDTSTHPLHKKAHAHACGSDTHAEHHELGHSVTHHSEHPGGQLGAQGATLLCHRGDHTVAKSAKSAPVLHHDQLFFTPLSTEKSSQRRQGSEEPSHSTERLRIEQRSAAAIAHSHLLAVSAEVEARRTAGGGGTVSGDSIATRLDSHKSVADLVRNKVIKDSGALVSDNGYARLKAGEAPRIHVVYQNKDRGVHAPKPNFVVDHNGGITLVHNPEGHPPDRDVVIQVERARGSVDKPSQKQQESIDALVHYEGQRIAASHGSHLSEVHTKHGPIKQVELRDEQGLVSENIHHHLGDRIPTRDLSGSVPEPTRVSTDVQSTSDRMNRVRGSHGSSTVVPRESQAGRHEGDSHTPAGYEQMVPPREVPAPRSEAPSRLALKDALAALFHPDRPAPAQTIREVPGEGYRLGRYGMNQGFTLMGLADMLGCDLGNPPDLNKLQSFLADHPDAMQKALNQYAERLRYGANAEHLPAGDSMRQAADNISRRADNFANPQFQAGFMQFLSDMKAGGQPITADRLAQFLPKELQETVTEAGIKHLAHEMHVNSAHISEQDAGRIALGVTLGRTPTAADLNNEQYQAFTNTAGNINDLTQAGRRGAGDIHVRDQNGRITALAERLAETADHVANKLGTIGYCARGVAQAVDASIAHVTHANGWDYGRNLLASGKFEKVGTLSQVGLSGLQRGDIVVRSWNSSVQAEHRGQNWGDVAVVLGHDNSGRVLQANDHHQAMPADGGRYVDSYVLRVRDSSENA